MLSKVIRRDGPQSADPIVWPTAGGERPQARKQQSAPAITDKRGQEGDEVARLERRIAELQAEMDRKVREAQQTGRREGEAAARKQAAAEMQAPLERLAAAIQETATLRDRLRRESEGDLVKLAIAIAQRILRRELSVDPDAMTGIIRAGFEKLKRQEILRVRVHPAHHAALSAQLPASGMRQPELVADPALPPGGLVFETSRGDLEASIDNQLREIERGLTDRLQSQNA